MAKTANFVKYKREKFARDLGQLVLMLSLVILYVAESWKGQDTTPVVIGLVLGGLIITSTDRKSR